MNGFSIRECKVIPNTLTAFKGILDRRETFRVQVQFDRAVGRGRVTSTPMWLDIAPYEEAVASPQEEVFV